MINQLTIKDTETLKNIIIQIDVEKGKVIIISNHSSWDNLAFLMEALGTTATICEEEGMSKKDIRKAIDNYLNDLFSSPTIARKRNI